ncbi:hypothetical protein AVEN_63706-1 [Araneus ventricosus]|uniref:Uncharacterized protein n=1 Tax=Araneus ventricosus TaxID=182803 RepID=A0A4Y2S5S0_ARAVE|nr:hypothetical protein AVEN_63706-1 [Araneus ventricosus]
MPSSLKTCPLYGAGARFDCDFSLPLSASHLCWTILTYRSNFISVSSFYYFRFWCRRCPSAEKNGLIPPPSSPPFELLTGHPGHAESR